MIGSCRIKKRTNARRWQASQWLCSLLYPAKMGGVSGYKNSCLPPHLRFLLFSDKLPSLLMPGVRHWNASSSRIRTSRSDQLADYEFCSWAQLSSEPWKFSATRPPSRKVPPIRSKLQRMLGLMAAALPILQLGLLHMRPIQFWLKQRVPSAAWRRGRQHVTVTRASVSALVRWRDPFWLKWGVILDTAHRRKVVTTDASSKGWGALCEGKPTFGLWSEEESGLHLNCLELLAVC